MTLRTAFHGPLHCFLNAELHAICGLKSQVWARPRWLLLPVPVYEHCQSHAACMQQHCCGTFRGLTLVKPCRVLSHAICANAVNLSLPLPLGCLKMSVLALGMPS